MKALLSFFSLFLFLTLATGQNYYYADYGPFDPAVPSPESFLEYDIGDYHTRHDRIVAYLEAIDAATDKASLIDYGKSHEKRRLVILQISASKHLSNLQGLKQRHLELVDPKKSVSKDLYAELPVFVNLGYNVHGNEPSSSEAAMLAAYVLAASNHPDIIKYREESVIFVDPTINPDGRDRHTQWANSHRSDVLNADPLDSEHNEMWPRGRTNHYWFDLNRDWLLLTHPESQGKLKWYHEWYPNVVTDFHEMGSNSSYFFEPMKDNASQDPIMPKENYTTLNDAFAKYYQKEMDKIGSLYFTKEVFDGTYPGYGSSYPDLQGGLGILFEQASSRGHVQETDLGEITFAFTIRNQFLNSLATVEASVDQKTMLYDYQQKFFDSAISRAKDSRVSAYVFGEEYDHTRLEAFLNLLVQHKIDVYPIAKDINIQGKTYKKGSAYSVPTEQAQYRMVQTMFETYDEYKDSVYYDASAWSLANAYNMKYSAYSGSLSMEGKVTTSNLYKNRSGISKSNYAYIISWDDYNAPGFLHYLQKNKVNTLIAQKPFSSLTTAGEQKFNYGSIVVPVQKQALDADKLFQVLEKASEAWNIKVFATETGYSKSGIDLGSRYASYIEAAKPLILIGDGTSSYEVGFVWHLLDQRVKMPITKLKLSQFSRADLSKYNTLVLVSGSYSNLDSNDVAKIKSWTASGNTLITIGSASAWAIRKKIVKESLVKPEKKEEKDKEEKDKKQERYNYIESSEINGKNAVGGTIFEMDLDITHPLGYGYRNRKLPVYRNNSVWVAPSKNAFSNVGMYTEDPHIDGFITDKNLNEFLKKSAPIVVSRVGSGRAVLFSEDPNFRGTWYGTNKLFLNAIFFGQLIRVP